MPYVITERCAGVCDTACVSVCPVDCIDGPLSVTAIDAIPEAERPGRLASVQLYIDPEACICCAACVGACPVEAIFDEDDVPEASHDAIEQNAAFYRQRPRS